MKNSYDLIIIGAGPAGLTAGVYACRYGLKTLILENYYVGGQMNLTTEIKNYPSYEQVSGLDLTEKMKNQYLSYSGELMMKNVTKIDFENKVLYIKNSKLHYKALILAMGASARKLELKNEAELTGHGISYCAICDGYFFKGKDVIVVGSGNSALEDSVYLSDLARHVYIVSKHTEFRAQQIFIDNLKTKTNITYFMGYQPSKINGNGHLESVEIKSNIDDKTEEIKADGMFIQIGRHPDSSLVSNGIKCNPAGFILTDNNLKTNIDGVFAAGDIRDKALRQIVTACGDGALASFSAFQYIQSLK